jgi:phosphotransferase system IIA component
LDGTAVNKSFIPGGDGVAVDAQFIYWTNLGIPGGAIGRANLDGTGVNQTFITGAGDPQFVAVDGQHIYWSNPYPSPDIGRANLDGTSVNSSFISGAPNASGVAVDGQHLYWSTLGLHTIGRANLDGTSVNNSFIGTTAASFGVAVDALQPPTASITNPVSGARYNQGQVVDSSFSCSEGASGPGIASCLDQSGHSSGTAIDTSTAGLHMMKVTATSLDGATGTASVSYTVIAPPTASITAPASGAIYAVSQVVDSSFSCSEGSGGPGIASCLDQGGHSSGTAIDTSTTGSHTFTITATSSDGQSAQVSVKYAVAAAPAASIAVPASGAIFVLGQSVLASYTCSDGLGGPGIAACAGPASNGAAIDTATPGTHVFTVKATSKDGQARLASNTYTVVLPPSPTLGDLKESHSCWRDGSTLAQISSGKKRPPVGTTFSFTLGEAATVQLVFTKSGQGRLNKVARKCAARTGHNKRLRKYTRTVTAGTLSVNAHIGVNKIAFDGLVSVADKLRVGRYTVTVTATNSAGEKSTPQSLRFTIVK